MPYHFSLKRNIHMYNHLIKCTCGENTYEAVCEDEAYGNGILFWLDDFGLPIEDKEIVEKELKEWSKSQGFKCILRQGNRC